jgi:hypothetical protein
VPGRANRGAGSLLNVIITLQILDRTKGFKKIYKKLLKVETA